MNPFQIIATLRKFGNFLVGLFPFLLVVASYLTGKALLLAGLLLRVPVIKRSADYLRERPAIKAFQSVFKRFYWRDYSKDRLSLDALPQDSLSILRPVFLISTMLCLLTPALMLPGPVVPIETFSGLKSNAPLWSVWLWLASAAIAWPALIIGTALSNRLAFFAGGVAYSYLCGTIVACAAKSPTNIFIPLSILVAILVHERANKGAGSLNACLGLFNATVLGAIAGIYFFAATTINMPETISSLWISLPAGALLGLTAYILARIPPEKCRWPKLIPPDISPSAAFWLVVLLLSTNLLLLCLRAGLSKVASHLISLTHLTESYAWPVWYLLAVGIVMKLIKNSDVVAKAAKDVVGAKLLRPVTIILILAGSAIVYCETALNWFSPGSPFYFISAAGIQVYTWTRSWFWREPIFSFSAPFIGPVLIFDLLCLTWLGMRRRLSNEVAGRVLYLTILAWFLISEYTFEVLSLSRSPSHSIVSLMLFMIWLLWLMHTIGLSLSAQSSALWPDRGRLPIYGSILIFALLEIHSRGALQDFKVSNELFLIMERGIVDVGLPYFLWVYARRRFSELPASVALVFCTFCLGALIALPFNALDKLAVCNWDWHQMSQLINALTQQYLATGNPQFAGTLPADWLLLKSACYCLLIWGIMFISWRVKRTSPQAAMTTAFILVSVASGVASFSKGLLEIGLPPSLLVATAPISLHLLLNEQVLVIYLAGWLPALILSLALSQLPPQEPITTRQLAAHTWLPLVAGFVISTALILVFNCFEDFLQSAQAVVPLLALYALLFGYLVARLIGLKGSTEKLVFGSIAAVCATVWFSFQVATNLSSAQSIAPLKVVLRLPPEFRNPTQVNSEASDASVFSNNKSGTDKSILLIGKVKTNGLDTKALLQHLINQAVSSGFFRDLKVIKIESWNKRYHGALACTFTYNILEPVGAQKITVPMAGATVLLPTGDTQTVNFVTIYTSPAELDWRLKQEAWIANQLKGTSR